MKPNKPWTEMTTTELRQATQDLNGSVLGKTRPLNAAERALWEKSRRRRRSRAQKTPKCERVNIVLERGLLREADKVAKKNGLGRSELIAQALATLIGRKKAS
ncbi:MAG: hypothetical protein ABSH08_03640 [Tepidisphaeraceae bacterium]|jgi:hypothetical protein